ncbi:DUF3830 family protein [Streptomyces caelestis]|uniref:DUF3830 family protein n=1 Tax=Streptomyces caelestis TaxID=36816 RepID=UPI0036F87F2F
MPRDLPGRARVGRTARLLDDRAPPACGAVRKSLPLSGHVHHAAYAHDHAAYARDGGHALFPTFARTGPPLENPTVPPAPGDRCIPVISANQVIMWAALRRLGTRAVGPYQALIDASARSGPVPPGRVPGPVPPGVPEERRQKGWT